MKLRHYVGFVLSISWMITSQAAVVAPAQKLDELLSSFHSLSANFQQEVFDTNNTALQKSKGTMAIMRPGKFRWNTTSPTQQLIVTDGYRLWIYDKDLDQVTVQDFRKTAGDTPAMVLTGSNHNIENKFDITRINDDQHNQVFKLIPKGENKEFKMVELDFNNNKIKQMKLYDNLDQLTVVDFTHVKLNPKLSRKLFTFKAPAGVDVIDKTKS